MIIPRHHTMKEVQVEWRREWEGSSLFRELQFISFEEFYRLKLTAFKIGPVLEAGCGFGRYCFWLDSRGVSSVGVDIVASALGTGKKHYPSSILLVADITCLPFKDVVFTGYVSLGVIEHFRSIEFGA